MKEIWRCMAKRKVSNSALAILLMVGVFSPASISHAQRNRSSDNGDGRAAAATAAAVSAAPASDARSAAEQITAAQTREIAAMKKYRTEHGGATPGGHDDAAGGDPMDHE